MWDRNQTQKADVERLKVVMMMMMTPMDDEDEGREGCKMESCC
jgi:hypothetical protein